MLIKRQDEASFNHSQSNRFKTESGIGFNSIKDILILIFFLFITFIWEYFGILEKRFVKYYNHLIIKQNKMNKINY